MAVLKQTSPTAWPRAPKPNPSITVPSSSTRRAVGTGSVQPESPCFGFIKSLDSHDPAKRQSGGRKSQNPNVAGTGTLESRLRHQGRDRGQLVPAAAGKVAQADRSGGAGPLSSDHRRGRRRLEAGR